MLLTPAEIKPKSFESTLNFFFLPGVDASCLCACLGARFLLQSYQYPNLSEGTNRVGGQLHGDKECPFSGVTKSGRVWRKVPESDAQSYVHTHTHTHTHTHNITPRLTWSPERILCWEWVHWQDCWGRLWECTGWTTETTKYVTSTHQVTIITVHLRSVLLIVLCGSVYILNMFLLTVLCGSVLSKYIMPCT